METAIAKNTIPVTFWVGQIIRSLFILTIPIVVFSVVRAITNSLVITNKQIHGKFGMFGTSEMSQPLDKVGNVTVEQSILGKILNYGYIVITDTANVQKYISASPHQLKQQIFRAQEIAKKEQLQDMARAVKTA